MHCGDIVSGLRFCAESTRLKIIQGDSIILKLLIVNESDEEILVTTNRDFSKYSVIVRRVGGAVLRSKVEMIKERPASTISYEDTIELFNSSVRRHRSETLGPKNVLKEQLVLSKIYDFDEPGRYSVEVKRITMSTDGENRLLEIPLKPIEIEVLSFDSKIKG